jgi:hypothetical protein
MHCKVDSALKHLLVNFPVEYSPLLQREQRPPPVRIARTLDYLPVDFQTCILLPDSIDYKIGLNQGQLAVPGSDLEKYSRVTVVESSR